MNSTIQKVMKELSQLTPAEKWQVMRLLADQLQSSAHPAETTNTTNESNIQSLVAETRGIWGNKSLDEVDAALDRQRQIGW